ncbi:pentatricopeptide repeat-containing protein At5g27110-like [Gossypium hirsutum]|uniref:Pentatricopeptide repeat-containing protein At5g27110-like n=1 Tax=Gossypium hirsutum TaxID=3635 RepID=A0ABM3C3W8_GOSHI|nr:pentatricopeptide repeat-containing protein At5g27110-like [Gossypium hirsutum]
MRDLVSWTAMITAYEQAEQPDKALLLFQYMQLHGVLSDSVTIVSVASAYVSVGNAIIAMYAKCGNVSLPRLVFDLMEERHVISWNSIILGYSQNGQASEALFLSEVMLDSEAFTNPVTKLIMVSAYLDTATRLFNDIPPTERNITSWNVLISGYDMHGYGKEALNLFSQMQQTGIKPDHITFTSLLSACGHAGLIDEGRKCFAEMKKHSESLRVKHYACMVDILGRAGLLNQAFDMVQQITIPKNDGV